MEGPGSVQKLLIQILEVQKLTDPTDPNPVPEHCQNQPKLP
jgi:hypothetical protein